MTIESVDRDGSLVLVIRRNGFSTTRASWGSKEGEQQPREVVFDAPKPKNKRITIHQSGRINFHESKRCIFVEPPTRLATTRMIYAYRVPLVDRLDAHDDALTSDDLLFDLSEMDEGPISFTVTIGPNRFVPTGRAVKLGYEGFAIAVSIDATPFAVPNGYEDYFTTVAPQNGPFSEQQVGEDVAMVLFHQALAGHRGPYVYEPNGEGFVRLVFSTQMARPPDLKVEFEDPTLHIRDEDLVRDRRTEQVMIKFKVRRQSTGEIVRQPVAIRSIELNAEL